MLLQAVRIAPYIIKQAQSHPYARGIPWIRREALPAWRVGSSAIHATRRAKPRATRRRPAQPGDELKRRPGTCAGSTPIRRPCVATRQAPPTNFQMFQLAGSVAAARPKLKHGQAPGDARSERAPCPETPPAVALRARPLMPRGGDGVPELCPPIGAGASDFEENPVARQEKGHPVGFVTLPGTRSLEEKGRPQIIRIES